MPQASDELHAEMVRICGDSTDCKVIEYLTKQGWTLGRDWQWRKPGETLQSMPQDEYLCVKFMIDEWDFGGVVDSPA